MRYPNPLPELPYAPKLVRIPDAEPNYTTPVYAQRVVESLQLPIAVDAEAGMPLDLARLEHLWIGDGKLRTSLARRTLTQRPRQTRRLTLSLIHI